MAIDLKYGRVDLERGNIGEEEAVVVFRAQDETLPEVLTFYRGLCAGKGSPERHLAAIDAARDHVKAWQANNTTQVPQSKDYSPQA